MICSIDFVVSGDSALHSAKRRLLSVRWMAPAISLQSAGTISDTVIDIIKSEVFTISSKSAISSIPAIRASPLVLSLLPVRQVITLSSCCLSSCPTA